jgi:glutamyl/glutaminyl-tRNA synthetase
MMHIGGLRIAFYNYLFAKKHNGLFLLRIEDTDRQRFKPDSVDNIISSLKWTNLITDHGVGSRQESSI